jgi:uridylate kinase
VTKKNSVYTKILLKISGEALAGSKGFGLDPVTLENVCLQIKEVLSLKAKIALVVGGGNIFRGISSVGASIERVTGDQMGMLATLINALALRDTFKKMSVPAVVLSAFEVGQSAETYTRRLALQYLDEGYLVIFAGGTGNPYFSTDTAAALRAAEINAQILLKATQVDGIYSADPKKNSDAKRFVKLSYDELVKLGLKVMDATAVTLCRENSVKIMVFDLHKKGNIKKAVKGENPGTLVS